MSDLSRIKGMGIKQGLDDRSLPGAADGSDARWTYSHETKGIDLTIDLWLHAGSFKEDERVDRIVKEIERETQELRSAGKLRPFVEGEPIGAYHKPKLPRRLTAAQVKKLHNEWMQRKQEAMLAHRKRNDEALLALLNKRF